MIVVKKSSKEPQYLRNCGHFLGVDYFAFTHCTLFDTDSASLCPYQVVSTDQIDTGLLSWTHSQGRKICSKAGSEVTSDPTVKFLGLPWHYHPCISFLKRKFLKMPEKNTCILAGCSSRFFMILIRFQNHNKSWIGVYFIYRIPREKKFGPPEIHPDRQEWKCHG